MGAEILEKQRLVIGRKGIEGMEREGSEWKEEHGWIQLLLQKIQQYSNLKPT